jgi:prepilin signal peptidase PulO-like enzyme (type II secretory pathway)
MPAQNHKEESKDDSNTQKISRAGLKSEIKLIPIVCPWCKTIFRLSKWEIGQDKKIGVSHGLCPKCAEKIMSQQR